MTRRSTPSSEMVASLITPPLEPSLSIARDRAETQDRWGRQVQKSIFHMYRRVCLCTCRTDLQTLLFAQAWFVVGVHEAVDVGAAASAHRHRLPHQHPTNRNTVHLRHTGGTRVMFSNQEHFKAASSFECFNERNRPCRTFVRENYVFRTYNMCKYTVTSICTTDTYAVYVYTGVPVLPSSCPSLRPVSQQSALLCSGSSWLWTDWRPSPPMGAHPAQCWGRDHRHI